MWTAGMASRPLRPQHWASLPLLSWVWPLPCPPHCLLKLVTSLVPSARGQPPRLSTSAVRCGQSCDKNDSCSLPRPGSLDCAWPLVSPSRPCTSGSDGFSRPVGGGVPLLRSPLDHRVAPTSQQGCRLRSEVHHLPLSGPPAIPTLTPSPASAPQCVRVISVPCSLRLRVLISAAFLCFLFLP